MRQAEITLWWWTCHPESTGKSFGLLSPASFFCKPRLRKGRIDFEYDATHETWAEFEQRIHEAVTACRKQIEADALGRGLRVIEAKRNDDHFLWAALHQTLEHKIRDIALSVYPHEREKDQQTHDRTIKAGIHEVLERIGLTSRGECKRPEISRQVIENTHRQGVNRPADR